MTEITTKSGNSLPYVMAYGNIKKALEAIIVAAVPDRFTQDFLSTKLTIKGGNAKSVIPFLKKVGFLNGDGTPTETYNDFRIESSRSRAANSSILSGYSVLSEMNEYFYDLADKELKELIVRATGMAAGSSSVTSILGSIKALKDYADFTIPADNKAPKETTKSTPEQVIEQPVEKPKKTSTGHENENFSRLNDVRLGYTININLPASSDIAVYNAIFKSLKDNILDD